MSSSPTKYPNIAIIGGGPSGLVALLTLLNRGIPATLYEREASSSARAYLGGMLDLAWDEGQRALRENGLADAFKANSRLDAQEIFVCGKDGVPLLHRTEDDVKDETKTRPEIDRRVLRDIMLAAIPESAVKWGHALAAVRPLNAGTGQHELTFTNGVVVVTDILIGADGARSRVRPLVSPAQPIYQGITGAEISVAPAVAALPENADILKGVGLGTCCAAQDGKTLISQRNGDGRIRTYALHRAPLEWVLPREPQEARRVLLEIYKDWAPWMRKLIEVCDNDAIYHRPVFYLPVGHRWTHKPGVTTIGDAAHLMSQFAGAGANLAMLDGLELGLVLADAVAKGLGVEEREAAVAAVEEKMCARAETFAALSYRNGAFLIWLRSKFNHDDAAVDHPSSPLPPQVKIAPHHNMSSSSDLSLDYLETLAQLISSGVEELRNARAEGTSRQLEQLGFLKTMFLDGIRISDALCNAVVPIHRLPPEILTHILSLLRDEVPVLAHFPARWPFKVYKAESLEPVLAVCKRWRDLALGTRSLWNSFQAVHDRGSTKHFNRSLRSPLAINIASCYTQQLNAWCRKVEGQIRELHIHVGWSRGEEVQGSMLDFLLTFSAQELIHCKIEVSGLRILSIWSSMSVPLFAGNGNKLRSLYLGGAHFLPTNSFPLLTRFALCHPLYITTAEGGKPWGLGDLIKFLSGSPLLMELYICRIGIHARAQLSSNTHPPLSVNLRQLRYLAIDASSEPAIIPAVCTIDSAIIAPPSCHRYYSPMRPGAIAEYLSTLPRHTMFRRLRMDFSDRNLLQLAGEQGSVSICMPIKSGSDWNQLYTLLRTSPVFDEIEELWLALGPTEYEMISSLPLLLSWFPRVRGLSITLNPYFAPHQWLGLGYVLSPLHMDMTACPLLDTLCVNLPGNVTSVERLEYVLSARSRSRRVRRLVVGYDSRLELAVLADVLALQQFVDELVIGEVMVPIALASDWLLDVPNAFDQRSSIKEGWPRWSENAT
ncbi:hypothetical protein C8T65DRAFT_738328 [Cerioporus squamosus]|nr:hypothetical protein C8T65DRAFT_738328 [Cerioporus squamosus]